LGASPAKHSSKGGTGPHNSGRTGGKMCIMCVPNDEVYVLQRCGKFSRTASAGLGFYIPCVEWPAGKVSLRINQLDVTLETKTRDNVFVFVNVSVQYEVVPEDIYSAFYRLANPRQQITAFVFDVIRSTVPKTNLDDVFDSKDEIANSVKSQLAEQMSSFGFNILTALVTDISPNEVVKASMNEINAATRIRQAATDKAEAEKILSVKAAEADAESRYLTGVGIARQRQAIVNGLRESVSDFTNNIDDVKPKDVLQLMLMTQYFDMMRDVGGSSKSNTIFVPHTPGAVGDFSAQVRDALLQSSQLPPLSQHMQRA